jgi:4,5-dihydroxyphthalate decarboxylase
MGPNSWAYGLEANRLVLETFLRYSYEQGLATQQHSPESLFAPETLESFVV